MFYLIVAVVLAAAVFTALMEASDEAAMELDEDEFNSEGEEAYDDEDL